MHPIGTIQNASNPHLPQAFVQAPVQARLQVRRRSDRPARVRVLGVSRRGDDLSQFGMLRMPESLDRAITNFVGVVYDRGEGMRYAFEQTLGYTVPRTMQQLYRTKGITGKNNDLAGLEMFVRDTAADFTDTFLGGLIATFGIGSLADRISHTYVRHNMGHDALTAYRGFLTGLNGTVQTRSEFYKAIETSMKAYAKETNPNAVLGTLNLERLFNNMGKPQRGFFTRNNYKILNSAHDVAKALRLPSLDVTLTHGLGTAHAGKYSVSLTNLISDLWQMHQPNPKLTHPGRFGEQMGKLLSKTQIIAKKQMWGIGVSLAASLAVPFAIRLMTRKIYGKDEFPGTYEIEKFFHIEEENGSSSKKFRPFPWIQNHLKKGDWLPLGISAGFFGIVLSAAAMRFKGTGLNMFKAKDWMKVYEFDRGFPYTTIKQMELTYGALVATRLAASRNDSEARESLIRDCALGWPTLTYFYKAFRGFLSRNFAGGLTRKFGHANLLIKPDGELRSSGITNELKPFFFENMGFGSKAAKTVAKATRNMQARISFIAGMVSLLLIAFIEPQIAIWLTNSMEMKKIKQRIQTLKKESIESAEQSLNASQNLSTLPAQMAQSASIPWSPNSLVINQIQMQPFDTSGMPTWPINQSVLNQPIPNPHQHYRPPQQFQLPYQQRLAARA